MTERKDDVVIPNKKEFIFSSDWSSQLRETWPLHVLPYLDCSKALHWLEIGSFEGRSALWAIENMLQHPDSTIVCVDTWDVWPKYDTRCNFKYEESFDHNTSGIRGLSKRKGRSSLVLPTLKPRSFHGCYIDGSHDKPDVLSDAHLVLPLMLPGAIVVFDDYQWPNGDGVRSAVDELMVEWKSMVDVLHVGYQVVFRVRP